jgi:predicted RND superfamily exporter protein
MRKILKYPWLVVAVITVITLFFGFQLPRAESDNNNLRFVPLDDPALQVAQWIDGMFGSSFFILIGLERRYGTVLDKVFLDHMREYITAIDEIPIVREITSLISADYITYEDDAIVVEKLVSDDFTATQILISLRITSEEASSKEVTDPHTIK